MALSEEQKKKIEEEEQYRKELRAGKTHNKWYQKTGWIIALLILFFPVGLFLMWRYSKWSFIVKAGLTILYIFFIFGNYIFGSASTTPSTNQNSSSQTQNSKINEEQKKQQLQNLSTSFCSERSKPNIRAVNLNDYIAMYEADGETVALNPANGVYPTAENCQKVAEICLGLWNTEECQDIAERKIWIGMTEDQLILSWGLPDDRNNSTYSFGVHSQWVYGTFGSYVYLEGKDNNSLKVTSWQD